MIAPAWWPILAREMALFGQRLKRPTFVVSALVTPVMYLLVFGLGLGRSVRIDGGDYLSFLVPGLLAMTAMQNSFTWVASALNFSRFYHRTYPIMALAPIGAGTIVAGHMLAGIARGLFATLLVAAAGLAAGWRPEPSWQAPLALLLDCAQFAALGVLIGMITRHTEEHTAYTNFLITPMGFFCGTFFPLSALPDWVATALSWLPLGPAVTALRTGHDGAAVLGLVVYTMLFTALAIRAVANHHE